jgi:hypothetical protein
MAGMGAADEVHRRALLAKRRGEGAAAGEMAQADVGGGVGADGDVHCSSVDKCSVTLDDLPIDHLHQSQDSLNRFYELALLNVDRITRFTESVTMHDIMTNPNGLKHIIIERNLDIEGLAKKWLDVREVVEVDLGNQL